jgi:hypothetical protein
LPEQLKRPTPTVKKRQALVDARRELCLAKPAKARRE